MASSFTKPDSLYLCSPLSIPRSSHRTNYVFSKFISSDLQLGDPKELTPPPPSRGSHRGLSLLLPHLCRCLFVSLHRRKVQGRHPPTTPLPRIAVAPSQTSSSPWPRACSRHRHLFASNRRPKTCTTPRCPRTWPRPALPPQSHRDLHYAEPCRHDRAAAAVSTPPWSSPSSLRPRRQTAAAESSHGSSTVPRSKHATKDSSQDKSPLHSLSHFAGTSLTSSLVTAAFASCNKGLLDQSYSSFRFLQGHEWPCSE
jgi:hypothetical protein